MNVITVSELTLNIKELFERSGYFSGLFVRGELSNFKRHQSGHCYFTLKDAGAVIRAVMFRSRAQLLKFIPQDGQKVIIAGRITVYERDGQYQLYAEQLIPDGIGELNLAYNQLKDRLTTEGLFDHDRKLVLPVLPQTIGIITSPTGAALRDIITVSRRRHSGIRLILCPVRVQGELAAGEICRAIELFNKQYPVDALIVGRGGGSLEELWAFNEEQVVRAVAASAIPIVSAVGHETDFTLTDFAADQRAATPSQAAELLVPDLQELNRYVSRLTSTLYNQLRILLQAQRQRLNQSYASEIFKTPQLLLAQHQQRVDSLTERLQVAFKAVINTKQQQFQLAVEKLTVLDPLAVLARGFAVVHKEDGTIVRSVDDLRLTEAITIILPNGKIGAQVIDKEDNCENNKTVSQAKLDV